MRTTALVRTLILAPAVVALAALGAAATPASAQDPTATRIREADPAWLGVSFGVQWLHSGETCSSRVLVDGVIQGSPAERAGIRTGDAILTLNGQPAPSGLALLSSRLEPGDSVRLEVMRDDRIRQVTAVADRRPERPLRVFVERTGASFRASAAPVVQLEGDTLIASNVGPDWNPSRTRSYWIMGRDGSTDYRSLRSSRRSDLDERVIQLLVCADNAKVRDPVWVSGNVEARTKIEELQARADTLRVMFAQRALERQDARNILVRLGDSTRTETGTVELFSYSPEGSFVFRVDEHVAVGMRAVAGAELSVMEPELADYFRNVDEGLLVLRIAPETPAARAGLQPGDVILAADGRRLETIEELRRIIGLPEAGDVELRIVRRGRTRDLTLTRD